MALRGLRGAITVEQDTSDAILSATGLLLKEMIAKNCLEVADIASIFFSVTTDLVSDFPAKAARELGLGNTPLLCMTEIPVRDSLQKCIRILIHVNSDKTQDEMLHVYLRDAIKLRPDLSG